MPIIRHPYSIVFLSDEKMGHCISQINVILSEMKWSAGSRFSIARARVLGKQYPSATSQCLFCKPDSG